MRTSALYGWSPLEDKDNLVTSALKKLRAQEKVTLVQDQWITPTFADDLARALLELAEKDVSELLHGAGPDCMDRQGCCRLIAKVFGLDDKFVVAASSSSMPLPARRPKNSCLDASKVEKVSNGKMASFEDGLKAMKGQELKKR